MKKNINLSLRKMYSAAIELTGSRGRWSNHCALKDFLFILSTAKTLSRQSELLACLQQCKHTRSSDFYQCFILGKKLKLSERVYSLARLSEPLSRVYNIRSHANSNMIINRTNDLIRTWTIEIVKYRYMIVSRTGCSIIYVTLLITNTIFRIKKE